MPDDVSPRLLSQIAQELSAPDVVFPTAFDVTLRMQNMLKRADVGIEEISDLMSTEPLMSSKILSYANSAAVRGSGPEISELHKAVLRIGLDAVGINAARRAAGVELHQNPARHLVNHI